jgi:hypothetical protein
MSDAVALVARLRQAVQGCTLHGHGPVHAWTAINRSVANGSVTMTTLQATARNLAETRRADLAVEGVTNTDPRWRKEVVTGTFIEKLLSESTMINGLADLEASLAATRASVLDHRLYGALTTLPAVCRFMEHHVFAVWDFMSLLKALQRHVTCVAVPWQPIGDPRLRRFVNEIVCDEESDKFDDGQVASHFEMYLGAMAEVGADTGPVERFMRQIAQGHLLHTALARAEAPPAAQAFVLSTLDVVHRDRPHEIAAVFAYGREDAIPAMFQRLLDAKGLGTVCPQLRAYLLRHIALDGDSHGHLARDLVAGLCRTANEWTQTRDAAQAALQARCALWDAILAAI